MNRTYDSIKLVSAAAALCMASGMATAQQVKVVELISDDAPAAGQRVVIEAQPEVKTESHITMIQKTDGDEFKVEINNGEVQAWANGKRVPRKQLKVTDKEIRILDKDGETIATFGRASNMLFEGDAAANGEMLRRLEVRGQRNNRDNDIVWENADGGVRLLPGVQEPNGMFVRPEMTPPPVMVGINMGSLDTEDDRLFDLLDEHDLDASGAIQIIGVIDGLPADKAGLREGDVIVRLDGEWGANPNKLRDVLMQKEPGDTLEVAVVRDGRLREIGVKLSAYNADKLGAPAITYFEDEENNLDAPFALQLRQNGGDLWIEKLTEELAEHPDLDAKELRAKIEALTRNLKSNNQFPGGFQLDVLPRLREMAPEAGGGPHRLLVRPAVPSDPDGISRELDGRIESLEARLQKLESMNERLLDRIDRLLDTMEKDHD